MDCGEAVELRGIKVLRAAALGMPGPLSATEMVINCGESIGKTNYSDVIEVRMAKKP